MNRIVSRGAAVLVALAVTLSVVAASSAGPAKRDGASITVWLSGTYAGATPGSTYRKWLDGVAVRYQKQYGGKVKSDLHGAIPHGC